MTTHESPQEETLLIPPELSGIEQTSLIYDEKGEPLVDHYWRQTLEIIDHTEREEPQPEITEILRDIYLTLPESTLPAISPRLKYEIESAFNENYSSGRSFFEYLGYEPEEAKTELGSSLAGLVIDYQALFSLETGLPHFATGPKNDQGEPSVTIRDIFAATFALARKYPEESPQLIRTLEPIGQGSVENDPRYLPSKYEGYLLNKYGKPLDETEIVWLEDHDNTTTMREWINPSLAVNLQQQLAEMVYDFMVEESGPAATVDFLIDETVHKLPELFKESSRDFLNTIKYIMFKQPQYLSNAFGTFYPMYIEAVEKWQRLALSNAASRALFETDKGLTSPVVLEFIIAFANLSPSARAQVMDIQGQGSTEFIQQIGDE